jgi:acyl carrier protein
MEELLKIINIVLNNKGKEAISKIDAKMKLRNDLGFNSLDLAELTVRIEEEFGVDIFEDGFVFTINDILSKIKS